MTIALCPGPVNCCGMDRDDIRTPLHEDHYRHLRAQLASGALRPGEALSLRKLAGHFGGSITPVRDAVWRLATERALVISPTRRISVPVIGRAELDELMTARRVLEPEAAVRGLAAGNPGLADSMARHDLALNRALETGDVAGYMAANHAFHFALYRAGGGSVLVPLIETVWVRVGPFMRHAFQDAARQNGGTGTDTHGRMVAAVRSGDAAALASAVLDDIDEGATFLNHGLEAAAGDARD